MGRDMDSGHGERGMRNVLGTDLEKVGETGPESGKPLYGEWTAAFDRLRAAALAGAPAAKIEHLAVAELAELLDREGFRW